MYVIFTDSPYPELRMLKKGFRHCFVVRDEGPLWSVFNAGRSHFDCSYWLKSEKPTIADMAGDYSAIISYNGDLQHNNVIHSVNILSCVGIAKYVLGINQRRILTPYQLYRWLHEQSGR